MTVKIARAFFFLGLENTQRVGLGTLVTLERKATKKETKQTGSWVNRGVAPLGKKQRPTAGETLSPIGAFGVKLSLSRLP